MVSDSPQTYAGEAAFQFIKDVPASWDATHVINGAPGEFITIARQHGDEWDLGSMTNWTPRTLHVPLSFLATDRTYTAEIYEDANDAATSPMHVRVHKQTVHSSEILTLNLAPGGGCAIRFIPANGK
jgi:alpha-glucosidase